MIKTIKDTYLDLIQFLKNPIDQPISNKTLKEKGVTLLFILIIDIAVAGICILLISIVESLGLFSMESHMLLDLLSSVPKSVVLLVAVLIIPLLEEIIFRLYLRYNNNYLLRFFLLLFYVAGKEKKEDAEKRVKKIWYKYYVYIFYFSALLFGFVHIFNFGDATLWLFPILTLPQICIGVFLGYLRVRYNLFMGFLLHAIHNLIFFLPFLLTSDFVDMSKDADNMQSIRIEAESTIGGGQGVAYNDLNTYPHTPEINSSGMDIEECFDDAGGENIGYTQKGEWARYSINFPSSGDYDIRFRIAKGFGPKNGNSNLVVELESTGKKDSIYVLNTGGFQTWKTMGITNFHVEDSGLDTIKITYGDDYNLNYFEFIRQVE